MIVDFLRFLIELFRIIINLIIKLLEALLHAFGG